MTVSDIEKKLVLFQKQMKEQEHSEITLEKYVKDIRKMTAYMKTKKID